MNILKFGGIVPKVHPQNLSTTLASVAENVNLDRGTIKAWRKPFKVSDAVGNSIWVGECCYLAFDDCHTSIQYKFTDCPRMFATNVTGFNYPVTSRLDDDCNVVWERLGLPCDLPAPVATSSDVVDGDYEREQRQYAYLAVKKWGNYWEKGLLSSPSNEILTDHDNQVTISGIPNSFGTFSVDEIWIYRSSNNITWGNEPVNVQQGGFYLIGKVAVGTTTFIDNVDIAGELYREEYASPPPDDLRDIGYWRNGQLAGLTGDYLAFSRVNKFHAWTQQTWIQFAQKPKRFIISDNTGYVLTDGRPYVIKLDLDCKGDGCHQVIEVAETLPIVSRRSAVAYMNNVVYASKDGLIFIGSNGDVKNLTANYYTQDQWSEILPNTMMGVIHNGYYFGFCDNYAFRLRLPDAIYESIDETSLTTLTLRPSAVFRSDKDELFLCFDNWTDIDDTVYNGIYRWNSGNEFMTWRWFSKLFNFGGRYNLTSYRVGFDCDTVLVKIIGDCKILKDKELTEPKEHRLPAGYTAREYIFELYGSNAEVRELSFSPDVEGLNA